MHTVHCQCQSVTSKSLKLCHITSHTRDGWYYCVGTAPHIIMCPKLHFGRANPENRGEVLLCLAVDWEGDIPSQLGVL